VHRYAFQLFALNADPGFGATPGRDAVMEALRDHACASGCLIGTYLRPDGSIGVEDKIPAQAPVTPAGLDDPLA
jgi:hypothetical protein